MRKLAGSLWCSLLTTAGCGSDDQAPYANESAQECSEGAPFEIALARADSAAFAMCLDARCGGDNRCVKACDVTLRISAEAARCIARSAELGDGIGALETRLRYDEMATRVVWNVCNTLRGSLTSGRGTGECRDIDVVTGAVVNRGGWTATP